MFAYCNNNSVNCEDHNGRYSLPFINTLQADTGCGSGGGGAITLFLLFWLIELFDGSTDTITAPTPALSIPKTTANTDEKADATAIAGEKEAQRYNYWAADLVGSQVVVSTPLTFQEARAHVAAGGSIMCRNHAAALAIVIANNYRNAVGPEKGCGNNYYWHYHPTRNHTGYESVHIWYYSEA